MLTAFLSYRYSTEGEDVAKKITLFLDACSVKVVTGMHLVAGDGPIANQIEERIGACNLFVMIRGRTDPGEYIYQELGFARGQGKPIIIVTNEGYVGGLETNEFQICLSKGEMVAAAELYRAIQKTRTKLGLDRGDLFMEHSPLEEIGQEGWSEEVLTSLRTVRSHFSSLEHGKALDLARQVYSVHPDCWRAGIAVSAGLVALERLDEADIMLDEIILRFSGSGRALSHAFQNKGWIVYNRRELAGRHDPESIRLAIECYRKSLKKAKRVIVYINLIEDLIRLELLHEAEEEFKNCLSTSPNALEEFRSQMKFLEPKTIELLCKSSWIFNLIFPKGGDNSGD